MTAVQDFLRHRIGASNHLGPMSFITLSDNISEVSNGIVGLPSDFAPPSRINWTEWFDTAQKIGATTVWMTYKHVDGCVMGVSTVSQGYCITDTPHWARFQQDVFGDFCSEARRRGMSVGVYFAVWDRNWQVAKGFALSSASYLNAIKAQLAELFTKYGPFDYIFLDGWGDFWGPSLVAPPDAAPTFTDIPHDTLNNYVHTLQATCLTMVNNHDDVSGNVRAHENLVDREPISGRTRPSCFFQPVRAGSVGIWFGHDDSPEVTFNPHGLIAAYSRMRMGRRNYPIHHNFSYLPTGRLMESEKDVLLRVANTPIHALELDLESAWRFDEALATADAVDDVNINTLAKVANPTVVNGVKGTARKCNGTTQYFTLPVDTNHTVDDSLNIGPRSFCFEFDITAPSSFAGVPVVFAADDASFVAFICFFNTDGKLHWRVTPDGVLGNAIELTATAATVANAQTHIIVGYDHDAGVLTMQQNGGTRQTVAYPPGTVAYGTAFTVACRGAGLLLSNQATSQGRFYKDRCLTESEGNQLYNSGKLLSIGCKPLTTIDLLNDLVIEYVFNEDDADAGPDDTSGNSFDGTLSDGVNRVTGASISGKAIPFLNSGELVSPFGSDTRFSATPITVIARVKPTSVGNLNTFAMKALADSPFSGWYLRTNGSNLSTAISIGGSFTSADAGALVADQWQVIAFTFDGGALTTWLNGIAGTPASVSGAIDQTTTSLSIGNDFVVGTRVSHATFDKFSIYNRILTSDEMIAYGTLPQRPPESLLMM